ncbi:MAG: hypothetical protein GEU75_08570 [Dehalococcoidia bacterium]|nr:hypothetical protein [Dehalococcoidia bacterium]
MTLAVLLLVAPEGDEEGVKVAAQATSAAAVATEPPAQPSMIPVRPAPGLEWDRTETTLVEVATGRAFDLRESSDYRIRQPQFSSDSRFLVYGKELSDDSASTILEIDLQQPDLTATTRTDGYMGWLSSTGGIVFYRHQHRDGPFILTPQGLTHTLQPPGPIWTANWSPDGRWLVYQTSDQDDNGEYTILIADALTGRVRIVDHTEGCQCDSHSPPVWSPAADYFTYVDIELRRSGRDLATPAGNQPTRETDITRWINSRQYVAVDGYRQDRVSLRDVYVVDFQTGGRKKILEASRGTVERNSWSPDGGKIAVTFTADIRRADSNPFSRRRPVVRRRAGRVQGLVI